MLKRINLYIQFPNEMTIDDMKIPELYTTHIVSNTEDMNQDKACKHMYHFFKIYNQNVDDYEFYGSDGKVRLSMENICKILTTPSIYDETLYCIYKK